MTTKYTFLYTLHLQFMLIGIQISKANSQLFFSFSDSGPQTNFFVTGQCIQNDLVILSSPNVDGYENMPIQYTVISKVVKNEHFQK